MILNDYVVSILPNLRIHADCNVKHLSLHASKKEYIDGILAKEETLCVGRVKKVLLDDYAVSVVLKLRIHEDSMVENLSLFAYKEEHVATILAQDQPFCVRRVKNMKFRDYAASILPKLRIHEDSIMESFALDAGEVSLSRILVEGDSRIELGRIRTGGLDGVPEEIRRKLRYTLVDREGKEVLTERNREAAAVGDGEVEEASKREANEVAEKETKKKQKTEETFFLGTKQS
ncbi:MAG: uncharacterized protein A8A55_2899 [Amphiamblys sp. WSBS2006]|nr:MAG: uncharacterized protein A8A55_2899 [Amphiamblys sp. WSBS2006]